MTASPQNPAQAIDFMTPITVVHVALMLLLAAAALATMWWGSVLYRRRRAAEKQVDADFAVAEQHGAVAPPGAASIDDDTIVSGDVPEPSPASAAPDHLATDLSQIKGLGPKLVALLGENGVTSVAQIAALAPSEADALDAKLGTFQGRMARDRWIEQARLLAANDRAGYEAAFGKLG